MEGTESTGSATTGPTTFSDTSLSWSDAPSASAPDQSGTTATEQPASATTAPDPSATEGTTPVQGEPPKERWADILDNARSKAREEAEAQWAPHAWAKQVPQAEFQQLQSIAKHFNGGDPIAGLQNLIAEIRKDPQHDAALRSLAAREMGRRTQPQQQAKQLPVIQLEDGTTVDLNALKADWQQEVEQRIQPFIKTVEEQQAERKAASDAQRTTEYVERTYDESLQWRGMDDKAFRARVGDRLALKTNVAADDPRDVAIAFRDAWREVADEHFVTHVQKAQSQQLDDLKRKAAATSVNPGSTANATGRTYTSFKDIPPEMWR